VNLTTNNTVHQVRNLVVALRQHLTPWHPPRALLQLGTGFGIDALFDEVVSSVSMVDVGLVSAEPSPAGHPLTLTLGRVGQVHVLVADGHRFRYETGNVTECILPVMVAALAGVPDVILLESGVALKEDLKAGTWMAATDYINAMGVSPVEGCLALIDDPFVDMTDAFSQSLNAEVINAAAKAGINPRLGVFQGTPGPHFDTPAEAEAARRNGADMLGNGVVLETVAAALMGCRVTALVLVAETASSYHGRRLRHADVLDAAQFCSPTIMRALRGMFLELDAPEEDR